ncbi:MAG: ABC transporter ATP-binding protein [Alphaproteobacteria bacterium]
MTPAIEFQGVQKFFGNTEVIRGVDLAIAEGEIHAIIGPNGAGKSTLFNLVTGRHQVSRGRVELNGEDITNSTPYHIYRKGLSRSFQVTNIFPKMSVFENVRCGLLWNLGYHYSFWQFVNRRHDLRERSELILEQTSLTSRRNMSAGLLSYSDQRALEIAVTIAGGARVILLDEPTSGMSGAETEQAVALIRDISATRTMVIVEHDMGVVFDLADRISVLVYGQVIATGTPEEIRANAKVQKAYLGTEAD